MFRPAVPHLALQSIVMVVSALMLSLSSGQANEPLLNNIGFNRHIRPILSDTCFKCHGPDKAQRKADLRLDKHQDAIADRGEYQAIFPGKSDQSELFRRVTSDDSEEKMPPPDSGLQLSDAQIELIRRWIDQGAEWEKHWSFIPPKRPSLPEVNAKSWPRNGIDNFISVKQQENGLQPSAEAEKETLIRRVTLDLTGLPPTVAEVDAFLTDARPDGYGRLVDRLLSSPRYGEHIAVKWLDLARYADTSGYQNDGPRSMWRWRDWVIDAYSENKPFDEFTVEQLAGDLGADRKSLNGWGASPKEIASAFNRNHRGNAEGGIIPEEFQVEYVVDRVDTTATVWLGLTIGCARCHDHKYDPFTQKEFYQLFAYFNNISESGRAIKEGNSGPTAKAPTPQQVEQLKFAVIQRRALEKDFLLRHHNSLGHALQEWERSSTAKMKVDLAHEEGLVAGFNLDASLHNSIADSQPAAFQNGSPDFDEGRIKQAAAFDGMRFIEAGDIGNFGYFDEFSVTAWIYLQADGTIVSRMTKEHRADGYYFHVEKGKLQLNLVKRWLDDSIRVETKSSFKSEHWYHVAATYDGSRKANGIKIYVDGEPEKLVANHDFLNQTFAVEEPLRIGAGSSTFRGRIDEVRLFDYCLDHDEVRVLATTDTINEIVAIKSDLRTKGQSEKVRRYFLENHASKEIKNAARDIEISKRREKELEEQIPTVMVMEDMDNPRDTFILRRGQYDKPGERVGPDVPAIFPSLPYGAQNNRLGLAQWLVDDEHPLTARVAVNRYWQMRFGTGIVRTMEDFGSQGERPSHPDLLDWLATEFMRTGWDVKRMQRLIVSSATYRQSSEINPNSETQKPQSLDPTNRLLWRGPRFRMTAEAIRDQALAASGLLFEKIGGPSVKPYQPEGLWKEIATDQEYALAKGGDLYRRSVYTYWKRTVSPPTMAAFDAPSREACTVRRSRTNTPLQALAIMNDPTFTEVSRALAERVMKEAEPEQRITLAFRMLTGRRPNACEITILTRGFEFHLDRYRKDIEEARRLVSVGKLKYDKALNVADLAAYTTIASLILNLDETITKE